MNKFYLCQEKIDAESVCADQITSTIDIAKYQKWTRTKSEMSKGGSHNNKISSVSPSNQNCWLLKIRELKMRKTFCTNSLENGLTSGIGYCFEPLSCGV